MKKLPNNIRSTPVLLTGFLSVGLVFQAVAISFHPRLQPTQSEISKHADEVAAAFKAFSSTVKTWSDSKNFYVESNGMPDHKMMVGITNWQQQVPIPQNYTGSNAWQFPLVPVPAANPLSAKDHFFRGALVIAANGIPVFNALNNRGEDSNAIGELDEFGGHCGRADDYHYHIAPTHLTKTGGIEKPIGYALDGYPLYSYTEPDGSTPGKLDAFNGHTTAKLGYHYHATKTYPYLNGGFHGEVTERGGQVDPQPRAEGIRADGQPLRGAKITGFETPKAGDYSLKFTYNGETYTINYALQSDGSYKFDYVSPNDQTNSSSYSRRGGGGPNRGSGDQQPPEPPTANGNNGAGQTRRPPRDEKPIVVIQQPKTFVLTSPSIAADGVLPKEFTGDGDASTPPLKWTGTPAGTQSFALIMHHLDPQGNTKTYWILYNIPASTTNLVKNTKGIGILGTNTINDRLGYAPPHSAGPGTKTYVLSLYALSEPLDIKLPGYQVKQSTIEEAMKGKILGQTELAVNYTRPGN